MDISVIGPGDLEIARPEMLAVYRSAFGGWPHYEGEDGVAQFADSLERHAQRDGFRCVVARQEGRIVGFAYGYTGGPGQWWYERVAPALDDVTRARWMDGYFEFVELAVAPDVQRQGVGGALHDALLDGLSHRTALLSTQDLDTAARRLYHRRGWVPLLRDFTFPGAREGNVIMGLDLETWTGERVRAADVIVER